MTPEGKVCKRCFAWKPMEAYGRNKISRDGYDYSCKTCETRRKARYKRPNGRAGRIPAKPLELRGPGYGEFGPLPRFGTRECNAEIVRRRAVIDAQNDARDLLERTGDGMDDSRFADLKDPEPMVYPAYGDSVIMGGFRRMTQRERMELVEVA